VAGRVATRYRLVVGVIVCSNDAKVSLEKFYIDGNPDNIHRPFHRESRPPINTGHRNGR
jgi:hypothetical protein